MKALERFQIDRVRNHAQLQPAEIFELGDRLLAVGDVAEAEPPVAEPDQTRAAAARRIIALPNGPERAPRPARSCSTMNGKVEQAEFRDDGCERGGGGRQHLLGAAAQRRLLLQLVAELGRGELADLELAAALGGRISANFCTPKLTGWSVLLRCPQRIVRSWTCAAAGSATNSDAERATSCKAQFSSSACEPPYGRGLGAARSTRLD